MRPLQAGGRRRDGAPQGREAGEHQRTAGTIRRSRTLGAQKPGRSRLRRQGAHEEEIPSRVEPGASGPWGEGAGPRVRGPLTALIHRGWNAPSTWCSTRPRLWGWGVGLRSYQEPWLDTTSPFGDALCCTTSRSRTPSWSAASCGNG